MGRSVVDDELVQERWFFVGAHFDVGALGAPVTSELVGCGPWHERVVSVAVDHDPTDKPRMARITKRDIYDLICNAESAVRT